MQKTVRRTLVRVYILASSLIDRVSSCHCDKDIRDEIAEQLRICQWNQFVFNEESHLKRGKRRKVQL